MKKQQHLTTTITASAKLRGLLTVTLIDRIAENLRESLIQLGTIDLINVYVKETLFSKTRRWCQREAYRQHIRFTSWWKKSTMMHDITVHIVVGIVVALVTYLLTSLTNR